MKLGLSPLYFLGFLALSVGLASACGGADEEHPAAAPATPGTVAPATPDTGVPDPTPEAGTSDTTPPPVGDPTVYDNDGTVPYDTTVEHVSGDGHDFNVTLYLPTTPGLHPAVSFSCGSTQTAAGYVPYGKRLASHGIAMILKDDPGALIATNAIVPDAVYVVDRWIPTALAGKVDPAKVGLSGHSRGGAVSMLAAEHGLQGKIAAWFGIDPVDNQFLISPGAYARSDMSKLTIPTAYLGASVTSSCAPAADSYPMLFPKTPKPSVLIVGQGAGHTQFELASACTACGICSPAGTANPDVVFSYALRYFTAFFARELLGDASVGAAFEGAGAPSDQAAGRVEIKKK